MTVVAVVGTQWGDEGKGKIVDALASREDSPLVIRFNGGDNAGHTIVNDLGTFKLRLVPSGVFSRNSVNLIGAGTLVNPPALLAELEMLRERGVSTDGVRISRRAHIVLPHHLRLEAAAERGRGGLAQGSTGRGIAPAYSDKADRIGLRVEDLFERRELVARLTEQASKHNPYLMSTGERPIEVESAARDCEHLAEKLGPMVADDYALVQDALAQGRPVIAEGQLGALRDLDWGIYPYSTSSTTLAGGACAGAGIPPRAVSRVVGVTKAYTSAVGSGPVAAELKTDQGDLLREVGLEYGTATGRPRRCGWFDAVATRFGAAVSGADELALTKLDVLDGLDEVRIVVGYRRDGTVTDDFPSASVLSRSEPVYESLPGWTAPTAGVTAVEQLPDEAIAYIRRIESLVGVPVRLVGTGPHRQALARMSWATTQG